ncbi:heterokaryon incompatibility protein-domain-containing protein, partial [Rhexocercosporidium sp. MPI-PUGE-AT-0058]
LLSILPEKRGTIIECTLEVVNLDVKPAYEALSYVWGPINPPVTILCNKHPVEVTPNLGAALQRLRYPDTGIFSNRRIWIDALRINQENLEERSQQVSFMKEIYDSAKDVVIWLGEEAGFA